MAAEQQAGGEESGEGEDETEAKAGGSHGSEHGAIRKRGKRRAVCVK